MMNKTIKKLFLYLYAFFHWLLMLVWFLILLVFFGWIISLCFEIAFLKVPIIFFSIVNFILFFILLTISAGIVGFIFGYLEELTGFKKRIDEIHKKISTYLEE